MKTQSPERPRWWDITAAIILLFAVFLASLRLSVTEWTDELNVIQIVSFLGIAFGLALGQSMFKPRVAMLYAGGMGIFTIGWQLSLLSGGGIPWNDRVTNLVERLVESTQNLLQQRAVSDPILFLTLMGLLFWVLSAYAGYSLTRHANPWRATLPMGVALFIIHIYDPFWPNRTWYIASYIFLALLLLSRTYFLRNYSAWKKTRTHLPPYIGLDILRVTMLVGGILVLISWTMPALASSVPPIEQAWQELAGPWYAVRSRMSNAFASLRATVGVVQDYYGEVLPLGRGNILTDTIVFHVEAPRPPSTGVRFYWRNRVYDTWNGTNWNSNPVDVRRINPNDTPLPFENFGGRLEATFSFYPGIQSRTLHTPSQPQWISRPVQADIVSNPDATVDIFYAKASPSLQPGEVYEVTASITNSTIYQLRSAGTNYPTWIVDRYLQLPESLSDRTRELAEQIAEQYNTPFDIADAVTKWLRDNITYNDIIPTPPLDQDIIDWMLFDLQQGFCNYYATAEILMLRSLGIPARLAVGYAQGALDTESGLYVVRQRDAHAWVEVYFPGIGWVEFEPTINQRPLQRLIGEPSDIDPAAADRNLPIPDNLPDDLNPGQDQEGITPPLETVPVETSNLFLLVIVGIIIVSIIWIRRRRDNPVLLPGSFTDKLPISLENTIRKFGLRPPQFILQWAYNARLPVQARAYQTLNRSLTWLGSPALQCQTPSERATTLSTLLPTAINPIHTLLQEYETITYGTNYNPSDEKSALAAYLAAQAIRKRTLSALRQRLLSRFKLPFRSSQHSD